jgi:hypothetical protein
VAPTSRLKLAKPEEFNGTNRDSSTKFKLACHMYLRTVSPNATGDQRVQFIVSYLEGSAAMWLEPYMEEDIVNNNPAAWLHNEKLFWCEFKSRYGAVNRDESNCVKLKTLKQKGTVQNYLGLFQTYSATLGYNDITL